MAARGFPTRPDAAAMPALPVFWEVVAPEQWGSIEFISDLHLGIGKDPATGQWHPTEDFRWADAFGSLRVGLAVSVAVLGLGAAVALLQRDVTP